MDSLTAAITDLLFLPDRVSCLQMTAELLAVFLPCDLVGWNRVDLPPETIELVGTRDQAFTPEDTERLFALAGDNPLIISHLTEAPTPMPAPRRLSDLTTQRAWHETMSYQEVLRHLAGEHQLTIGVNGKAYRAAWAFNRSGSDFTDAELAVARQVQPLLTLLDRSLGMWDVVPRSPAGAELTQREEQVLGIMSRGVTITACGRLLGVSPRTVDKHLEHIYRKLGCDNLVTALARAHPASPEEETRPRSSLWTRSPAT